MQLFSTNNKDLHNQDITFEFALIQCVPEWNYCHWVCVLDSDDVQAMHWSVMDVFFVNCFFIAWLEFDHGFISN